MSSLNVVCYWWGDWAGYWGPVYVKKLHTALKKHTTVDYNFYCFTDTPNALEVPSIRFEPKYKWNLSKFQCHEYLEGRVLILDLDMLILDNIDDILSFSESFITCEGAYQKGKAGGSIVGTTAEYGRELLSKIKNNKQKIEVETGGSERFFIRKYVKNCQFWQDKYPGIYSWKKDCQDKIPEDARIIRMHGNPRPHELITNKFVRETW